MVSSIKKHKLLAGIAFILIILGALGYLKSQGIIIDFSMVKMYRMDIEAFLMKDMFVGIIIFALIYIVSVGLSLPFATPLTVLAGFLFGNILGTAIVIVAATIGATIAMVLVRFFFGEYVRSHFGNKLKKLNDEFHGHGFRDIFILRLMPIVPFALINIGAGLLHIKVRNFFFATLIGTIPFTFVYVNAGTQIAKIQSIGDIISFQVLLGVSLVVFSIALPVVIRRRSVAGHSQNS